MARHAFGSNHRPDFWQSDEHLRHGCNPDSAESGVSFGNLECERGDHCAHSTVPLVSFTDTFCRGNIQLEGCRWYFADHRWHLSDIERMMLQSGLLKGKASLVAGLFLLLRYYKSSNFVPDSQFLVYLKNASS